MATSADQHGVLKRLKEEVTCPLCLDTFKDPKRLPCDHVYCRECLHGLALRSLTGTISCPECRTNIQVPNHDVSIFTTSHQVNRLIEMYEKNLQTDDQVTTQPEATCKDHNSQPLALYCDTCKRLICRDCALSSCSRNDHKYGFIDEMAEKHQKALNEELEPIRKLYHQMSSALREVTTAERELEQRKEEEIQKINATFDSLTEILAQERRYCTEAVEKSFQEQSNFNSAKENELSEIVKKLKSLVESFERSSQNESKQTFLINSDQKKQSIHELDKAAREVSPYPVLTQEKKINLLCDKELKELCLDKNFIYDKSDPLKTHFDRNVKEFQSLPINKPFDITLYADTMGEKKSFLSKLKLESTLHSSYSNSSQTVKLKEISPNKYSLSFVPHERGNHELHIKYKDTHICGSPIPIYVTIEPEEIMKVSKPSVVKTMKGTCSVMYCNGKIYFNEFRTAIYVLNASTHNASRIIQVFGVCSFLIHKGLIFVTDVHKNRLLKMNINGEIIKAVGEKGDKPGQFHFPNGIRLSRDSKLYVCDSRNNRIQVFDTDLNLLTVLGRKGVGDGCFLSPNDLDFDNQGNLYVADYYNCRVQVLTPQSQHIRNIGKKGSGPGELDKPVSVAIHRDMVYITDPNNKCISVFKCTGEFVTTFGKTFLVHPETIAIDEDGYIYVTDNRSKLTLF